MACVPPARHPKFDEHMKEIDDALESGERCTVTAYWKSVDGWVVVEKIAATDPTGAHSKPIIVCPTEELSPENFADACGCVLTDRMNSMAKCTSHFTVLSRTIDTRDGSTVVECVRVPLGDNRVTIRGYPPKPVFDIRLNGKKAGVVHIMGDDIGRFKRDVMDSGPVTWE